MTLLWPACLVIRTRAYKQTGLRRLVELGVRTCKESAGILQELKASNRDRAQGSFSILITLHILPLDSFILIIWKGVNRRSLRAIWGTAPFLFSEHVFLSILLVSWYKK